MSWRNRARRWVGRYGGWHTKNLDDAAPICSDNILCFATAINSQYIGLF